MPHDPKKAKGFKPKKQPFSQQVDESFSQQVDESFSQQVDESSEDDSYLSTQMALLISADQQKLNVLARQLETYGEQRSAAVIGFFGAMIDASNAAIEDGVKGINRGLSPNFLQETGLFFQNFKTLKSPTLRLALPSTESPLEGEVIQ